MKVGSLMRIWQLPFPGRTFLMIHGILLAKKFFEKFKADHMELHSQDIQKLSSLMMPMHLKENDLAVRFRQNKFNLKMCEYSFKLLMSFLQDNGFVLLLRIINEHINILAFVGKSKGAHVDEKTDAAAVVTGSSFQMIAGINSKPILSNLLPEDQDLLNAIETKMQEIEKSDDLKIYEADKRFFLQRKSMVSGSDDKMPSRDRIPLPKFKEQDVSMEISALQELRNQIKLSRSELPSIACYTFHNTHDALTSLQFSRNSALVSTGSDESIIRVWSLKGEHLYGLRNDIEISTSDLSTGSKLLRFISLIKYRPTIDLSTRSRLEQIPRKGRQCV
jgi:transcription initiation factor TFIID subunit 5